jgi:hypothetical protein
VLLLAFLDEAKPSQRVLTLLNQLEKKFAGKNLLIVRVYEAITSPEDKDRDSSLPAALVRPGLLPGGHSEAFQKYGVKATPTLFLIDRQGKLRHADIEADRLDASIEALLKL